MGTSTVNFGLYKPDIGESGATWAAQLNSNMDKLDAHTHTVGGALTNITVDTTYYVSTSGNDVSGTGAVGAPWATISKALTYLQDKWINTGVTVTISCADGSYSSSSTISVSHPCSSRIIITGGTEVVKSCSGITGSTGTAGNYSVTITLNSVTNISAGDYALITGVSGGTLPYHLVGCHYVSAVGGSTITVTVKHLGTAPSGAVSASVYIMKTRITFTGVSAFSVLAGNTLRIKNIILIGNLTGGTTGLGAYGGSVLPDLGGYIRCGDYVGCVNWINGAVAHAGGRIYMTSKCFMSGNSNAGVLAQHGASVSCYQSNLTCNSSYGIECAEGSHVWAALATLTGNNLGVYAHGKASVHVANSQIQGNPTCGVMAKQMSEINATSATISNSTTSCYASKMSFIDAYLATTSVLSPTPAGTVGNENSVITTTAL